MKLSSLRRRGADCTSATAKPNSKSTKNQYKQPKNQYQKNNTKEPPPKKKEKKKKTSFCHSCIWGLELRLFPGIQENVFWFFGIVACFFWELFSWCFWYWFFGNFAAYYLQSAPLLHKLDNVVHEDEYLAPEAFGNVTIGGLWRDRKWTHRRKKLHNV